MDPLTLAMIGVLIVVGYFLIIRPQQKRTKEAKELQESLQEGSRVMMSGGIFGTIRHMGDKQVVVEVSPGVELTFVRQAIIRPLKDDEDEFEYADITEPAVETVSDSDDLAWAPEASADAVTDVAPSGSDDAVTEVPASETAEPTDKPADKG
jgi:preprotein translocase subunit YajC